MQGGGADSGLALEARLVREHDDYVRRLARSLVFDDADADDLAQRVWLAALRRPPRHAGALRGWLATIARNLATGDRRADARRARREADAARPEPDSAADELAMREEQRGELVREVLALEPALRDAIILRYFDGLAPRAIAARLGLPPATVKTRLKRGLATLRERLDRTHGNRAAWSLAWIDVLRVEPSNAALLLHGAKILGAGVLMTTTKKLAWTAALVVAAFLTWRVATDRGEPRMPEAPGPIAAGSQAVVAPDETPRESRAARGELRSLSELFPQPPRPAPKTGPGALEVTVVRLPEKTAVANVLVNLRRLEGAGRSRPPLAAARTDAQGIARFSALEPGDLKVDCDRIGVGVSLSSTYAHVASGETRRVTLGIQNHVAVRGRVVDRARRPIEGAEVCLTPNGVEFESHVVATTSADGTFELEPVEANAVYVHARKPGFAPSARVFDRTIPGKDLDIELVLTAPGASLSGTVRDARGEPIAGALVLAGPEESTSWLADDGVRHLLPGGSATRTDDAGRFEFASLAPGPGELHVEAEGFLEHDELTTLRAAGSANSGPANLGPAIVDIVLRRGAAVAGTVHDAASKPVPGVHLQVRALESGVVRQVDTDDSGAFRLEGLAAGAARGWAVDAGGASWALEPLDLREGEVTNWNPVLATGGEIVGTVLDERAKPANNLTIVVSCQASDGEPYSRAATTDKQGRFRVQGCRDAPHELKVFPRGSQLFAIAELANVRPSKEELAIRLDPLLRPSAIVSGKVVDADGRPCPGARVTPTCRALDWQAGQLAEADGTFRTVPLPAGAWSFEIEADGFAPLVIPERAITVGERLDLGTLRLSRGDRIVAKLALADGVTVSRVYATVESEDGAISSWCKIDGDELRTPPLPPGRYRLAFEGSCAARVENAVVRAGEETRLEIALDRGVGLRIRLERATDDSESRCTLRVRDGRGEVLLERSPRKDHVGPFTIPARFAPGSYLIEAEDTAGRRASLPLLVTPDKPGELVTIGLR